MIVMVGSKFQMRERHSASSPDVKLLKVEIFIAQFLLPMRDLACHGSESAVLGCNTDVSVAY